ncbi:TetR/AcrR family transcriptional regulator [Caproiciproducens sp.]
MEKKTDLRVIKTEKAIKKAFLELMREEGFSNVTVKKIIERAEINRGTFYIHYADKYDLLNKMEDELLSSLIEITKAAPNDAFKASRISWEEIKSFFSLFVNYVYDNGELFTLLQSDKGDPAFAVKFNEMSRTVWEREHFIQRLSIPQNYALAALISMTNSLITEWVKSGFRETKNEFMQIVFRIVKGIPINIFDKYDSNA